MKTSDPGRMLFCGFFVACVLMTGVCAAEQASMPPVLQQVFNGHKVPESSIGILVREVGADEPLLSMNADKPFNPASTIKLLTTWLALEELGPAYTWPTEAYLNGKIERGVLRGDLIIKGYGDPYFISERMWRFQRQLRMRGLRSIDGDLVIDNSYFSVEQDDPAAFDGEGLRVYNVLPNAFLVNFQAVQFYFMPDMARNVVNVAVDPMPANLSVENRLNLGNGYCGGYQNGIALVAEDPLSRDHVTLSGSYRKGCREYALTRSVLTGPTYAYGVFRSLWEETGGTLGGELRLATLEEMQTKTDLSTASDTRKPFLRATSPPLADVIGYINKYSNNVMARHLFLTMGAEAFEPPATLAKARKAAAQALQRRGMDFPKLRLDNGSGLSRNTRIAAGDMAAVLLRARQRPWDAEFVSSLSLPGLDGTMRKRFRKEEMTGQMHMKTGRLQDVFATAGYVHARSGREYVVVILQNYAGADRGPGEEAQAALLRWVYEQ
jgi:D-alanyl-D-alanine carboxypeptidase/D-alanyl-D-alanine-endopeptidase (penicillin-binding protein 4)